MESLNNLGTRHKLITRNLSLIELFLQKVLLLDYFQQELLEWVEQMLA